MAVKQIEKFIKTPEKTRPPEATPETVLPKPEVLARDRSNAIRGALEKIYPEKFIRGGEFSPDENPTGILNRLQDKALRRPDVFVTELQTKGRNENTLALLDAFGIPDEIKDEILPIPQISRIFIKALPLTVRTGNAEQMVKYYTERPDALRRSLITAGRNENTEALVRQLYPQITDRGLQDYFSTRVPKGIPGVPLAPGELPTATWLNRVKELRKNPTQLVPFVASGVEIITLGKLMKTAQDLEAGREIGKDDLLALRDYVSRSQMDTTWGYEVADIISQLVPFAGEFVTTGGIFSAGKTATVKAGEQALKRIATRTGLKILEGKLATYGLEVTGILAGGTLQTIPAGITRIPAAILEKQLTATLTGDEETVLRSAVKALGEQWIETVSERMGGLFTPLTSAVKGQLVKVGLFKAFKTANPGSSANDVRRVFEKLGYNGVLEEMLEERLADVGHGILQSLGLSDQKFQIPSVRQLLVELAAFSVPGAAALAIQNTPGIIEKLTPKMKQALTEAQAKPEAGFTIPEGKPEEIKQPWQMTREEMLKIAERDFPTQKAKQAGYFDKARQWHEDQIKKALSEGKPVPPEVLKDYPDLGQQVKPEPVAPENDPVAQAKFKLGGKNVDLTAFISISERSFPSYFTVKQAQAIRPDQDWSFYTQKGTKEYNRIPITNVLDELADKWGMTVDQIKDRVEQIRKERARIKEAEATIKKQMVEPIIPEEVSEEVIPPLSPPPQSVTPPPTEPPPPDAPIATPSGIKPEPTGSEITRIGIQSQLQVEKDKAGNMTRLFQKIPGLKQLLEFEQPGLKMTGKNEKVLVAMVAENAAKSDVSVWATSTRLRLLRDIRKAFGNDTVRGEKTTAKFLGTPTQAKNPITGTLKDIADNPELYELSNEQQRVLADIEARNDQLLNYVVTGYNAEIGRFTAKEGGAFLPNVDISEEVTEYLGSEIRAVTQGRGKTRVWQTVRERMAHDKTFTPETDVQKLLEGLDNFKASAAAGQTYKTVIGGFTRLEAMEKTHPELYKKMSVLKARISSLQGSAGTIESNVHKAIFNFLNSPIEATDLTELKDQLDVKLKTGIRKGMDVEAVQNEIASVREDIRSLKPAWEAANLKPYVFIQEGLYRYFPAEQANLIKESRKVTNNPALNFIEKWRGQTFSGDFSPFAIQGFIGVLADPWGSLKAAMGGVRTTIQEHDWNHSISVEALADDIANNPYEWSQFASLMGRGLTGTPKEYAAGFLSKIHFTVLGKEFAFDKFTEMTYTTVTRGAFNLWQRNYKNLIKHGVPELEAKIVAANLASQVYPLVSATRLGQSQARHAFLRAIPTSYSFIRQPVTLIAEAVNGLGKAMIRQKLTPAESLSLKTLITLAASSLVVSATSAAIHAKQEGGDDDDVKQAIWDAINPDPHNGKFLSILVGNLRIPISGPYRAIFRAVYPQKVEGSPFPLPFAGLGIYIKNRLSPAISTQVDLILNKDYSKQQIVKGDFPENIARFLAYEFENFLPLTLGAGVEAVRQGEKYKENIGQQMIGQFMGVNPVTLDNTYFDRLYRQLGQPKDTEARPYSIQKPDIFTFGDLWSGVAQYLKDLDPATMTEARGYKPWQKTIAEGIQILDEIEKIPNRQLISVNADYTKGDTFIEFYNQWYERSLITDETELAEFDKKYPDAYLGNMTMNEYLLLQKYHNQTDEMAKGKFLEALPENKKVLLMVNPRTEWLKSHPKENANLAIGGKAKILTQAAYDEAQKLIKQLNLADDVVTDYLPPKEIVKPYFERQDTVDKFGANSWEDKLLRAKNPELNKYLELGEVDTPIASLEIKTKTGYRNVYKKIQELGDKDSPDYIPDEKARADAIKKLKTPEYLDDTRRIEAIEKGTNETPTDKKIVEAWVDRGKTIDQFTASSSEVKVWLLDHPDVWKWALDNEMLTDDGKDWNEPVLRINATWREQDKAYDALQVEGDTRAKYLAANKDYRIARRQRDFYSLRIPEATDNLRDKYVDFYELPDKGFVKEHYLLDNPDLEAVLTDSTIMGDGVLDKIDLAKVPDKRYDEIYSEFQDMFDEWDDYGKGTSPKYIADEDKRAIARKALLARNTKFRKARTEREGYLKLIGQEHLVPDYVAYSEILYQGKPTGEDYWFADDWFLLEHPEFYRNMVDKGEWQKKDFSRVPTKAIFQLYQIYDNIIGDPKTSKAEARRAFRRRHPDFDAWLVIIGAVSKTIEQYDIDQNMAEAERVGITLAGKREEINRLKREIEEKLVGMRR